MDSDSLRKSLGRTKISSQSLSCSIPLYSKDHPTPYFKLEISVPQVIYLIERKQINHINI